MRNQSRFVVVFVLAAVVATASGCGSGGKSNADALAADGRTPDSIHLDSSGFGSDLAIVDSAPGAIDVPFAGDLAIRDGGSAGDVLFAGDLALRDGGQAADGITFDMEPARDLADGRGNDGSSDTPAPDAGVADAAPSYSWIVPYAEGQTMYSIAQDADFIYWGGKYKAINGVYRVSKSGGTPSLVASVAPDIYTPGALVVDAGFVYFLTDPYGATSTRLFKAPVAASKTDGGSATTLLVDDVGFTSPLIMAAGRLYYSNQRGAGIGSYDPTTGSRADIVSTNVPAPTDTGCGMEIGHNAAVVSLVSDGVYLYYYKSQTYGTYLPIGPLSYTGWIIKVPLAGGAQTILTPGLADECGIKATTSTTSTGLPIISQWVTLRLSDSTLYWSALDGFSYYKMSTQGGAMTKFLSSQSWQIGQMALAIDGPNIYYWCYSSLCRTPVAGGDEIPLLPRQGWGSGSGHFDELLVDDTSVYVVAGSNQAILRVAK